MRKVILIILILALLGGGGFCLYWFVFRKTDDGGYLSNRETLFVVQNVLENNGVNLDEYIDDAERVSYTSTTNAVVYADGEKESLTEKFEDKLVTSIENIETETQTSFKNYSDIIVYAWKMLYSNVFGNVGIRQNVWYETDTYKKVIEDGKEKEVVDNREYFKIYSNEKSEILISYFNQNEKVLKEVEIDYDLRNTDVSYRLIAKETKITGESSGKYVYNYFSMKKNYQTIFYSEDVSYSSNEKYIAISDTTFIANASKFSLLTDSKMYLTSNGDEEFKTQAFTYLVEKYDLTFYSFDEMKNVKSETAKKLLEFKK